MFEAILGYTHSKHRAILDSLARPKRGRRGRGWNNRVDPSGWEWAMRLIIRASFRHPAFLRQHRWRDPLTVTHLRASLLTPAFGPRGRILGAAVKHSQSGVNPDQSHPRRSRKGESGLTEQVLSSLWLSARDGQSRRHF